MIDDEMAEAYIDEHSPSCKEFPKAPRGALKQAFLAGFKAGKDNAEADIAAVAYVQGATRYRPEWHKVADKLPEENQWVLVYDGSYTVCNYHSYAPIKWLDNYENEVYEDSIIAWCEIPKYND